MYQKREKRQYNIAMLLKPMVLGMVLSVGGVASEFIPYEEMASTLLKENVEKGLLATTQEVEKALHVKDTVVVDVRTKEEWAGAHIKGSRRVGRQSPEKAIELFVLDDDDKLIKDKLIVVCNTAHRASLEALIFRKMGFKEVKVYPIDEWIDSCKPIVTKYSRQEYAKGHHHKFGSFYAEFCKEKKGIE
jgi:rhodanese-related sulfurtransferase